MENDILETMSLKRLKRLLILLLFGLFVSLFANLYFIYQNSERNRVVKVVDGDSFQTKDARRIRLLGIDAPELKDCLGEDAKVKLTSLTLGKRVKLTDVVADDYGRILANVWVGKLLVNKILLEEGLSRFVYVGSPYYEELKLAAGKAKEEKRGIYSSVCRKESSLSLSDCIIKGNIREKDIKIYHLPTCINYTQVIIDEAFGDRWFCTETEAQKAGFRKASGC